jgi:hypothetical protein
MIVKENVTVYQCEFCKKKLYREQAMLNHELFCYKNPINVKSCIDCKFIETIEKEVEFEKYTQGDGWTDFETYKRKVNVFRCSKLDKIMYPFKVERLGIYEKYPNTFDGQEPMPSNCESRVEGNVW